MEITVKDFYSDGEKGKINLNDKVFSTSYNESVIYETVKNSLANARQGTASSKIRKEMNRSTKKPWKQKGLGRARAGSAKSPIWRGGAVVFGPRPRDFSYTLPKKVKKSAFCSVLSALAKNEKMTVVADFQLEEFKTKTMSNFFSKVATTNKVLFVVDSNQENISFIRKSCNNLATVKTVNVQSVELKDLFYAKEVVFTQSAVEHLNNRYGEQK